MDDVFKIFVDQLREGKEREFDETIDPAFLEINEQDLVFKKPILLSGSAYLAEDELVMNWSIETEALVACSICNELVPIPLKIENAYFSEELSKIKTGIYSFKDLLRETILLEVPLNAECDEGNCPRRADFAKFLKDPSTEESENKGFHPFENLDWKN